MGSTFVALGGISSISASLHNMLCALRLPSPGIGNSFNILSLSTAVYYVLGGKPLAGICIAFQQSTSAAACLRACVHACLLGCRKAKSKKCRDTSKKQKEESNQEP